MFFTPPVREVGLKPGHYGRMGFHRRYPIEIANAWMTKTPPGCQNGAIEPNFRMASRSQAVAWDD